MTVYRRVARSLSRLIRSKCLAIFETLFPAPGCLLIVTFGPALLVGREEELFSEVLPRVVALPFFFALTSRIPRIFTESDLSNLFCSSSFVMGSYAANDQS